MAKFKTKLSESDFALQIAGDKLMSPLTRITPTCHG